MPILSRQTVKFNNKATNTMCEFYSEVVDAVLVSVLFNFEPSSALLVESLLLILSSKFFYMLSIYPAGIYLFKVSTGYLREIYKTCLKLTIKTPKPLYRRLSDVFIVTFEQISQIFVVFPSLTLNNQILARQWTNIYSK